MITDFTELTGVRSITYNSVNSLTDMNVLICKDTEITTPQPVVIAESLPYRDGFLNMSRADGIQHYGARQLTYVFLISLADASSLADKISSLTEWVNSGADELTDSDFDGWKFTGLQCAGTEYEVLHKCGNCIAKFTAVFACDPYMTSTADPTERRL